MDVRLERGAKWRDSRIVLLLSAVLAIHTGLLAYSAYVHSPTHNEPAHLAAGVSHWELGHFDLYKVNPPLVRQIAALPVMAAGARTEWNDYFEGAATRPEFAIGDGLIAANGERSFFLFTIARWACIPFSWLGSIVCFLWARDLYGPRAGLVAAVLWCFEPNILAHAALITPDAPATALGLAACYTFWRWLRRPTWSQTLLTGVVLGVAELSKTTLLIFYPLWPLLWIVYRLPDRATMCLRDWTREGLMLITRLGLAVYVVNCGYGFEGSLTRLAEFRFESRMFTGKMPGEPGNRFADSWLGSLPVPVPRNYLLGIDAQKRDFENYRKASYLHGTWSPTGWWYYYFYAMAIKVPVGVLCLVLATILGKLAGQLPSKRLRDEAILLFPAIVILTFVSSQTGFSEHMRYVLPIFPFFFIWISQCLGSSMQSEQIELDRGVCRTRAMPLAAAGLLIWAIGSSLCVYPHSLSYFNELVGGPRGGHAHLLDSNLDWGQDLKYVKWWLETRLDDEPVFLAFNGPIDPIRVGIEVEPPASVADELSLQNLPPGWYAISVSYLRGVPWWSRLHKGQDVATELRVFTGFLNQKPIGTFGYSIYLYKIHR